MTREQRFEYIKTNWKKIVLIAIALSVVFDIWAFFAYVGTAPQYFSHALFRQSVFILLFTSIILVAKIKNVWFLTICFLLSIFVVVTISAFIAYSIPQAVALHSLKTYGKKATAKVLNVYYYHAGGKYTGFKNPQDALEKNGYKADFVDVEFTIEDNPRIYRFELVIDEKKPDLYKEIFEQSEKGYIEVRYLPNFPRINAAELQITDPKNNPLGNL